MTLIYVALIAASVTGHRSADSLAAARRIAATVGLAAQEYGHGVAGGRVVAANEVSEARLFLTAARQTAQLLPEAVRARTEAGIDSVMGLVDRSIAPDSVRAATRNLVSALAAAMGSSEAVLEPIPDVTPSLARGAAIFRRDCVSCHGESGRGDGVAGRVLRPPPADLTDPATLADATPLSFYQRITIGVAGTAMPAFEPQLPAADRWAVALYASMLRQRRPGGTVPASLRDFPTVAVMTDSEVLAALGPSADRGALAAVRSYQPTQRTASAAIFASVRDQVHTAVEQARAGAHDSAAATALDAYLTFEQVESTVEARNAPLVSTLEAGFATLRSRAAGGATPDELSTIEGKVLAGLEEAERVVSDRMSPTDLFVQSLVIMLREGLEAILIIGALIAFLVRIGAGHRRRDIHIGVGAAIAMSLLTAVLLETVFVLDSAHREALEGFTLVAAVGVLFYVSYWLLSKMEVSRWTAFVKQRLQSAVTGGSAFALASAAFLAVYREGFETVLFYKALFVAGGSVSATFLPVVSGIAVGAVALTVIYVAINRWGVRLPLKPFFGVTSAFLYYMAFVFAGKAVAELQEVSVVPTTVLPGWPRLPAAGIYPTIESLAAQGVLVVLALVALFWIFVVQRRRDAAVAAEAPPPAAEADVPAPFVETPPSMEAVMLSSLERMEADLAELRSEVQRMRDRVVDVTSDDVAKS
jgi:high-affinity iron transporter